MRCSPRAPEINRRVYTYALLHCCHLNAVETQLPSISGCFVSLSNAWFTVFWQTSSPFFLQTWIKLKHLVGSKRKPKIPLLVSMPKIQKRSMSEIWNKWNIISLSQFLKSLVNYLLNNHKGGYVADFSWKAVFVYPWWRRVTKLMSSWFFK